MTKEKAIKIVKEFINGTHLHMVDQEALETLIPELKENEDERIRKEINTLYSDIDTCISELLKARTDKDSEAEGKALFKMEGLMVATLQDLSCIEDYLEKQKEQQPSEYLDLDNASQDYVYNHFCQGADFTPDYIKGLMEDAFIDGANWQKEQKLAEWNEKDKLHLNNAILATMSDWGVDSDTSRWLKSLPERFNLQPKQEWSDENEANLDYLIDFCNSYHNGNTRTLPVSTARLLSGWLYRVKSGEIPLPKSRLDEKDETTIHLACEFIRHHSTKIDSIGGIDCSELIERLKSLRPHWKPSEKQIKAFKNSVEHIPNAYYDDMWELYEQLKKFT